MPYLPEAVLCADPGSPGFDRWAVYLDRASAVSTEQMVMVVVGRTVPVDRLALVGPQDVDLAGGSKGRERAINGCQPHGRALGPQACVQLLGRREVLGPLQASQDRRLLTRELASGHRVPSRGAGESARWAGWPPDGVPGRSPPMGT